MQQAAVAGGHADQGESSFLGKEVVQGDGEVRRVELTFDGGRRILRLGVDIAAAELFVGQAAERSLGGLRTRVGLGDKNDLAAQLAAIAFEVRDPGHRGDDDAGGDRAVGARRPGDGDGAQVDGAGLGHAGA